MAAEPYRYLFFLVTEYHIELLALVCCIYEVTGLILGSEAGIPVRMLYLSPTMQMLDSSL
jgi:hypothetical protein